MAQSGIGYTVKEIPLKPATTPLLNDKGQVVVMENGTISMYQPVPDYGRPAGVHAMSKFNAETLIELNNNGSILWWVTPRIEGALWKDGQIYQILAADIRALNNLDQVVIQRKFNVPSDAHPQGTVSIFTPGQPLINALDDLPHEDPDRADRYSFWDINDHGLAAGEYVTITTFNLADVWYPAIWEVEDSFVRKLPAIGIDTAWVINNKNQLWGSRYLSTQQRVHYLHLPAPDYGMAAGFHHYPDLVEMGMVPGGWTLGSKLTDHGELFFKGLVTPHTNAERVVWFRGKVINPSKLLTDGNKSDVVKIHDINNRGAILGTGALNGAPNKLLLYEPGITAVVTFEPEKVELGETFKMNVAISNETDEPFVLAGVLGESYKITGTALPGLQQLTNPPPTRLLPAGESWTQVFSYRATQLGDLQFSLKAVGSHATGFRYSTDQINCKPVEVFADLLRVEIKASPAVVDLDEDQNGDPIFQDVTATVTITNLIDAPLENVEISDFSARPQEEPPPVPVPVAIVSGPFDPANPGEPVKLGTLAAGGAVTRTYKLRAQAEGKVDLIAVVRAKNPFRASQFAATAKKVLDVKQDLLFVFDAHTENISYRKSTPMVLGGNSWRVVGTLENRSEDETLMVQLSPELRGNAFYAQPIPDGTSAPHAQCACGILLEIPPEKTIGFRAPVRTLATGGTRGSVVYRPKVWIKKKDGTRTLIHDERGTPAKKDDRVVVTDGSAEHAVSVDVSDEVPRQPFADELIGHFLVGTAEGLWSIAEGIGPLVDMAAAAVGTVFWDNDQLVRAATMMTEFVVMIQQGLTPAEFQAFMAEYGEDIKKYMDVTSTVYNQIIQGFNQKITDLTVAWERGDTTEVVRFWGQLAGENPDLAAGFMFGICKLAAKSVRVAEAGLRGYKAAQAAELEARLAAGTGALKPWDDLTFRSRALLFGIDHASDEAFKAFAKEGYVLAVRRRGAGTIEKLRSGRYVTKPYHIKAKNVSFIDSEWLGFPADKIDEVILKEPPAWPDVQAKMLAQGEEADSIAEVRLRWETRAKEWWGKGHDDFGKGGDFASSERAAWQRMNESGNILYNQRGIEGLVDNFDKGFAIPIDDLWQVGKKFELELTADGSLVPKIEGKYVTGDIDPMYVGKADGSGWRDLTDAERIEVYRLFRDMGFQHPESRTWKNLKVNEYFKEFSIHNPKRDSLAMYLPDGRVVASFFDPRKSWQNAKNWRDFYMFFRGGVTVLNSKKPSIEGARAALQDAIRRADEPRPVYVAPGTWALISPDCPGSQQLRTLGASPASCPIDLKVSNAPAGLVLRQTVPGFFEIWTPDKGWQPYAPPGTSITITPQTCLSDFAVAGASSIAISSAADLGINPSGNDWFEVGQTIVINPGGYNQETAVITGFGSLLLDRSLRFDHEPREIVAVISGSANGSRLRLEMKWVGLNLALEWSAAADESILEESPDLISWQPSSLAVARSGERRTVVVSPVANKRFFRTRRTDTGPSFQ